MTMEQKAVLDRLVEMADKEWKHFRYLCNDLNITKERLASILDELKDLSSIKEK